MSALLFSEVSMGYYFCGWYFRCQSNHQTLAIIPSFHKTKEADFCTIQLITDTESFYVQFHCAAYHKDGKQITIADNRFTKDGITLDIKESDLCVSGSLRFSSLTPIRYDIMGPFQYVPFMQCRHSIFSMHHSVNGTLVINGSPYLFQNAIGYIEGDRGHSFPKEYVWTQCSYQDGALMLSIADIPFGFFHFTGVIGVALLHGKEYRLATYLGAKAVKITPKEIIIRQRQYTLTIKPQGFSGHSLRAPTFGAMNRTIHEYPSCRVHYRFEDNGVPLLELDALTQLLNTSTEGTPLRCKKAARWAAFGLCRESALLLGLQNKDQRNHCGNQKDTQNQQNDPPGESGLFFLRAFLGVFGITYIAAIGDASILGLITFIPDMGYGIRLLAALTFLPVGRIIMFPFFAEGMDMGSGIRDFIAAVCTILRFFRIPILRGRMGFGFRHTAADRAYEPVSVLVAVPGTVKSVGISGLVAADIAVRVTGIVKFMSLEILLLFAAGTGIPVTGLVSGPFLCVVMLMIQLWRHHIAANQTDLILFLCGCGTGIVLFKVSLITADGAGVPVAGNTLGAPLLIVVRNLPGNAANIAVGIAGIVIGMGRQLGNLFIDDILTGGTVICNNTHFLTGCRNLHALCENMISAFCLLADGTAAGMGLNGGSPFAVGMYAGCRNLLGIAIATRAAEGRNAGGYTGSGAGLGFGQGVGSRFFLSADSTAALMIGSIRMDPAAHRMAGGRGSLGPGCAAHRALGADASLRGTGSSHRTFRYPIMGALSRCGNGRRCSSGDRSGVLVFSGSLRAGTFGLFRKRRDNSGQQQRSAQQQTKDFSHSLLSFS